MENTLQIQFTPNQIERVKKEWSTLAGEPVEIEVMDQDIYAFGSELACLRLFYKFRNSADGIKVDFSKNRNSWFFLKYKK